MTASAVDLHAIEIVLLVLLCAIVIVAGIARKFSISYPIVLVVAGLISGLIPAIPNVPLSPHVVFLVFLPPLLFSAAWQTSWREFRFNLVSISMLAVGLVFFTALAVAYTAHLFLPSFNWQTGFLLGAVVSTTDAVAATSIASRIGMPRRIVDLLEGESLVNDATGLLALQFGLDMMMSGRHPTLLAGLGQMLWLLGGGVVVGLLVGALFTWLQKWIDDGPVQIAISLITAYGVYLVGEAVGASGVIAVVACGLYMSRKSHMAFSPGARLQTIAVWDALEFLLNGLVFIMIGLQLPYVLSEIKGYSHRELLLYGAVFSGLLIAVRMLWMFPASTVAYKIRRFALGQNYQKPPAKGVFLLAWTGMRGVVALAAASSLPFTLQDGTPFRQRNMIVFLTFSVILVTLVLQGTTLPALMRLLKLGDDEGSSCEEGEAREILLRTAIKTLEEARSHDQPELQHAYEDVLHQYEHRLESLVACGPQKDFRQSTRNMESVLLEGLQAERNKLVQLRHSGRVSDHIYRTLERELDLSESHLS